MLCHDGALAYRSGTPDTTSKLDNAERGSTAMSETEELLRNVLRQHAEDAPNMHGFRLESPERPRKWRWLVPLSVAAVTAAFVLGVAFITEWHRGTTDTASVPDP